MANDNYDNGGSADKLALSPPTKKRRTSDSDYEAPKSRRRTTRSTRSKQQERTSSESTQGSPAPTPKPRASARKVQPKAVNQVKKPRRVKEDVFNEPDRLFGPQKSLLYKEETDVMGILQSQKAIEVLSSTDIGYPFLDMSKKNLHHYVELFKTEGTEGYHDGDWLNEALAATEERAAGVYDAYLEAKFKEEWGDDENEYYTDTDDEKEKNGVEVQTGEITGQQLDTEIPGTSKMEEKHDEATKIAQ